MKRLVLLLGILCLWAGCEKVDFPYNRDTRSSRTGTGGGSRRDTTAAGTPSPAPVPDTVVWVCAVKVPEDYDWGRDSSAGRFGGELLLYRNSEAVLKLPLDAENHIGASPGTHHILGGHLYTEYSAGGITYINKDGEPLLEFPDGGLLKGLLVQEDGALISLTCRPGEGFVLRRDAETVLKVGKGTLIGGFGEGWPVFWEDGGRLCFNYRDGTSLFCVRDGIISAVNPPETGAVALDYRRHGGQEHLLWRKSPDYFLSSGGETMKVRNGPGSVHFFEAEGELYAHCGQILGLHNEATIRKLSDLRGRYFRGEDAWFCPAGGELFSVCGRDPLLISWGTPTPLSADISFSDPEFFIFTDECAASVGKSPLLGASAYGKRPRLIRGNRAVGELPFNGYITAVSVELIPPSL